MSSWKECNSCNEEYQVIGGSLDTPAVFCPFCGTVVEDDEDLFPEEDEE
jgi:hypothetical protein